MTLGIVMATVELEGPLSLGIASRDTTSLGGCGIPSRHCGYGCVECSWFNYFYEGNHGPSWAMQVILGSVNSKSAIGKALWCWESQCEEAEALLLLTVSGTVPDTVGSVKPLCGGQASSDVTDELASNYVNLIEDRAI